MTVETFAAELAEVIEHEARHLLGYEHAGEQGDGIHRVADAVVVSGPLPQWQEQGPGPATGNSNVLFPAQQNPTIGAIQAVAAHPANANEVRRERWWRNLAVAQCRQCLPVWTPISDQFPSTQIGALAFDVNNPNVLWAGTGSFSSRLLTPDPRAAVGLLRGTIGAGPTRPVT